MVQNTVDVKSVTNTRHQKWKDNVKKKFIFIYRYDNSCTDNEEAAIWLLYGDLVKSIQLLHDRLAYTIMNELS